MKAVMEKDERIQIFDDHRGRLFGIAYRMLGTAADAEDILQDAYIRWHGADPRDVKNPEAWLVTVVTRLSIDRLRKASRDRETYIGPWLPEPLITSGARTPEDDAVFASDLSLAFLTMLERLSPTERAVQGATSSSPSNGFVAEFVSCPAPVEGCDAACVIV